MFEKEIKVDELKIGDIISAPITKNGRKIVPENTRVDEKVIKGLERFGIMVVSIFTDRPPESKNESHTKIPYEKNPTSKFSDENLSQQLHSWKQRKKARGEDTSIPKVKPSWNDTFNKEEAIENIRELFAEAKTQGNRTTAHKVISKSKEIVEQLETAVTANPEGRIHIHELKKYDEYTFHHSLSVALLSIVTGKALGLGYWDIMKLGQCAFLHDIGKKEIPLEILNKPAKLNDDENKIMQKHPIHGASFLEDTDLDIEVLEGVKFHHEKLNGSGYPYGKSGKDIPLFSRIIAVADVFDACTSFRPYREPEAPHIVVEKMLKEINISFDHNIVTKLFEKVDYYPINTVVVLSDDRAGAVVGHRNRMRPIVKLLSTEEYLDLSKAKDSLYIKRVIYQEFLNALGA